MATAEAESTIPTGTWRADPVHSHAGFSVRHAVGTFRGHFDRFDATLTAESREAGLSGRAPVSSVRVKDENLYAHLQSPDFFDAERNPEIVFDSREISVRGDEIEVSGELSIRGVGRPVVATGQINGPAAGAGEDQRIGIDLETTVNRYDYGIDWQMELPGGGKALGDDVTLEIHLELVKE
jgi:polyisoprenoid-binding protein YceI